MLAYSTIGQMGFVLLGLLSGVVNGNTAAPNAYSSAMFYIVTYVLTTLASFGVILLLAREGFESEEIADLAGLNQRSPLYAGVMAICLFSLAGIPPLVGFYAKLAVLQALVVSGSPVYIGLAIFAVMMSLVAAFYYLRVVKVMYFDAPITATTVAAPADVRVVLTINGALVLVLGILPGGLMTLCARPSSRRWRPEAVFVSQAASVWLVIVLAFCRQPAVPEPAPAGRGGRCARQEPGDAAAELVAMYFVVGGIGLLLEKRAGQIAPQGWEFYAVTGALFLTFAFPASCGVTCTSTGGMMTRRQHLREDTRSRSEELLKGHFLHVVRDTCGCPTAASPRASTCCIPARWPWCRCWTTAASCWSASTAIRHRR
jgi:hypothetical protein